MQVQSHSTRPSARPPSVDNASEAIFQLDEDIPLSNAENSTTHPTPPVPAIIVENLPPAEEGQVSPIDIPTREHRPYSYSTSVPNDSSATQLTLISIMANKTPLESLTTKQLRLILLNERVSTAHLLEKRDLIQRVNTLIQNVRGELRDAEDDNLLCKVCVESTINCVLLECGHYCLCLTCAETIKRSTKECPICRQPIIRIVHTFRT